MRRVAGTAALLALVGLFPSSSCGGEVGEAVRVQGVAVDGTRFRVMLSDGRIMAQTDLPGTILALGDRTGARRLVRIDAVEHDPKDQSGEVVLYQLSEQEPASGEWRNLCQPDPEGRRLGFPLAGSFTQDGRYLPPSGEAERSRLLITCTGGAEGKCVRLGYKPWGSTPDGSSLAPYYQACVRLIRADYCGDGQGHTRNGTAIDIFDKIGIVADGKVPEMTFEAAWAPAGGLCATYEAA